MMGSEVLEGSQYRSAEEILVQIGALFASDGQQWLERRERY
jgi:hypothetical protein